MFVNFVTTDKNTIRQTKAAFNIVYVVRIHMRACALPVCVCKTNLARFGVNSC